MNNDYEYIGYAGAFFISINLIPQIIHIYKNKNADSISVTSIILGIISSILMLIYGIFIFKIPIIISNCIIFLFYCIILFFKYLYSFSTVNNININYFNV
jgi:uncharacterized protein with PQ loop repeat